MNGLEGSFFHERRQQGQQALEQLGLPGRKTEDWKYTPTGELGRLDLEPANAVAEAQLPALPAWVQGMDAYRMVFANGRFVEALSVLPQQSGVQAEAVSSAMERDADAVATWFDSLTRLEAMPYAALNSALYQDGAYIRVDRGVAVDKPVVLLDYCAGLGEQGLVLPRHLLVAEAGSSLRVLHVPMQDEGIQRLNGVVEAFVERDARVEYELLQDGNADTHQVQTVEARVCEGARFDARSYQLGGALVRNDINVRFAGEHAEADLRGFYLALDRDLLDHHLILDHAVPNCYSNQLYKGVADGHGTTVFNGKIFVRKDAQKTNAYQSNKNLLLSPKATVNTKPQLEIFADDVRCSHGATSGQLNPEALFYLQARGIPAAEARTMLLRAFAAEALEGRPEDAFRERVLTRLNERLS